MTVYLIAQPTVDTSGRLPKLDSLGQFGRVRVLINPGEDPRYNPKRAAELIQKRLEGFNPQEDYLVWAGGDTLAALLTGIVLSDMSARDEHGFDAFQWLRWERGRDGRSGRRTDEGGHYVPITVHLPNPNGAMLSADEFDPITTTE